MRSLFLVGGLLALCACGDDQDPERARALWDRIHAEGYRSFARAPGYETRRPTRAPHAEEVDIYVNAQLASDLGTSGLLEWGDGALIVKDGWDGDELCIVAAMHKQGGEWFYVEWNADGDSLWSGRPQLCTGCHAYGQDYVRSFGLP